MTSRERVLVALGRKEGSLDRAPLQFDLCRQLTDHFGRELGIEPRYSLSYYEDLTYRISANEIRTKLGSDCVVVGGTVAKGFHAAAAGTNTSVNEFGMHMKPTDLYVEVVRCPLAGVSGTAEVESYRFPAPYAPGRFDDANRDIEKFGKDFYLIGDCELSIFELAWHLTGMQEYLIAMAMEEEWVSVLNDRVEEWTLGLATQLVKSGVDAIWFGEDLGTQTSMLISPDNWRELFKPRYARMIAQLKSINPELSIIMHSDGAVAPLIDDFIEIGVGIYNPVQPNVPGSDPEELQAKYGGRISFFGGIDQQELLPRGDLAAIEKEVKFRASVLGRDGGYIIAPAHIIQADVAPSTVKALARIVREL